MKYEVERIHNDGRQLLTDTRQECWIPFNEDDAFTSFRQLGDAITNISQFAKNDDSDKHQSSFIHFGRSLMYIFEPAYDTDDTEDYRLPIHGRIFSDMRWYEGCDDIAKTITVEKTTDEIHLVYEDGFHATDETVFMDAFETDELLYRRIYNCGKGVKEHHCPYMPEEGEKWRRRKPSKIKFSFEITSDGVRLGIENIPPEKPQLWYWWYEKITQIAGPYANVTFSLEDQTSTVQYVVDQAMSND